MKIKRILACLAASIMVCSAFVSCGDEKADDDSKSSSSSSNEESSKESSSEEESSKEESSASESASESDSSSKTPVAVETVEVEDAVAAKSGDAYLAIVDSQWWVQYWGNMDDAGSMLAYNAGVVPITGNGDYTVSVTSDTNGFRLDTTGDANGEYVPGGLSFMSVMIKDGETLFPNAVITVNSIKVDGAEIPLSAKAYTSSDDGIETRANLFNQYVDVPSSDGRSVDGTMYVDYDPANPAGYIGDYAPTIVNVDDFSEWTTVEVNFTVSGIA